MTTSRDAAGSSASSAPRAAERPLVFDESHYASTLGRKLARCVELGPKYYAWDLPRYFLSRRALRLPLWDVGVLWSPLRAFGQRRHWGELAIPPGYHTALEGLGAAGVRLTMPSRRLEALARAWWATRAVPGDVIECGSYRGATALTIALLGKTHGVTQRVLMLDTFRGIPERSAYDVARSVGEFTPPEDQERIIWRQAEALGVPDRIEVHAGLFSQTFGRLAERDLRFAFVHIDANVYTGTWEACEFTIPRTAPGGVVVFDDYNGACDLGARLAIERYLARDPRRPVPLVDTSAYVRVGP